jgi:hypothetical protein
VACFALAVALFVSAHQPEASNKSPRNDLFAARNSELLIAFQANR